MRLFSYVVAVDSGFAPNPFWQTLTLACCKPKIRLSAEPGDMLVGIAPRRFGNDVVYVARVHEKLTFREYWRDKRFLSKRPNAEAPDIIHRCGDNIYEPTEAGRFRQLASAHSHGADENPDSKDHDLGGRFVLVCQEFSYFGSEAVPLPDRFAPLIVGRAHRCNFSEPLVAQVNAWRATLPRGVRDRPRTWKKADTSWRQ